MRLEASPMVRLSHKVVEVSVFAGVAAFAPSSAFMISFLALITTPCLLLDDARGRRAWRLVGPATFLLANLSQLAAGATFESALPLIAATLLAAWRCARLGE